MLPPHRSSDVMASDKYTDGYCGAFKDHRLSRLSIQSAVAEGELSDEGSSYKHVRSGISSLPGTPERRLPRRAAWDKEYDSDAEVRARRSRARGRERSLDKAWEIRRSREASAEPDDRCRVLVRPPDQNKLMRMDMDEMKACRDLGIGLPPDWTVEIPYVATSSGGNSPVNSWRISSPGDDPKDVKARLKTWAHAVALASTTTTTTSGSLFETEIGRSE